MNYTVGPEDPRMRPVLDLPAGSGSDAETAVPQQPEPAEPHHHLALRERFRAQARNWWTVTRITFKICMRYRITGLAAEAAFFALLSLPPLAIGLAGTLGYLNGWIGAARIAQIKHNILGAAGTMLSGAGVQKLDGLLTNLLTNGHPELISIGFLLALWAGSRAMNVYVDTITIAYGLSGRRGIVRTRLLAFGMYMLGLLLGSVALPLLVIGPDLLVSAFPPVTDLIHAVYWPVMLTVLAAFLNTLYHLAVPVRTPWSQDLPGTVLALLLLARRVGTAAGLRLQHLLRHELDQLAVRGTRRGRGDPGLAVRHGAVGAHRRGAERGGGTSVALAAVVACEAGTAPAGRGSAGGHHPASGRVSHGGLAI